MAQPFWENFHQFLWMLSIHLSYDPATLFLGIYGREMMIYAHKNVYQNLQSSFIAYG